MSRKKLGRGLQALLGVEEASEEVAVSVDPSSPLTSDDQPGDLRRIPLRQLEANPFQPRKEFDDEDLASLARSIQQHGVIQPIVVRRNGGGYQLVAGERRWRAAEKAGLDVIPARVLEIDDRQTCELALVENLQRRDLNAIEKANAFQGYLEQFGSTHEELATHLGVDRSSVSNLLRLLELPAPVQEAVRTGQISYGHARALLSAEFPEERMELCRRIVDESLSVRQTEALVKAHKSGPAPEVEKPDTTKDAVVRPVIEKSNHVLSIENDLRHRFGVKAEIHQRAVDKGTVILHFESHDDFERILALLKG